jgi:hypothetical protein
VDGAGVLVVEGFDGAGGDAVFEAGGEAVQVSEQSTGESADGLKGRGEGCGTPYLHEHNYARRIPRRMPEPSDRDNWEKQSEIFGGELITQLEDPACDVFFGDEAGFEGDPRPLPKWVKRGSRPTQGYFGGHLPCRTGKVTYTIM